MTLLDSKYKSALSGHRKESRHKSRKRRLERHNTWRVIKLYRDWSPWKCQNFVVWLPIMYRQMNMCVFVVCLVGLVTRPGITQEAYKNISFHCGARDRHIGILREAYCPQWFFYVPLKVSETAPTFTLTYEPRGTQSPMLKGEKLISTNYPPSGNWTPDGQHGRRTLLPAIYCATSVYLFQLSWEYIQMMYGSAQK